MDLQEVHQSYISEILIKEIAETLLPNKLLDYTVAPSGGLDGFMSALYFIDIKILDVTTNEERSQALLAKFMKGEESFRVTSRSYIQFCNEISIYSKVIPYYSKILKKCNVEKFNVENWAPKVYVAKYGNIDGLSNRLNTKNESVLVMENLKPFGFTLSPHLYLNKSYILGMLEPLAEYHAMSHALKIMEDPVLEQLKASIIPLPFVDVQDKSVNLYDPLYRIAFERFFDYFERSKDSILRKGDESDQKVEKCARRLKQKYGAHPTKLLEYIRLMGSDSDSKYSIILHGDFNRNNVLFRFAPGDVCADARMIDFQEVRVGSPCIDLSFAMYMNMDPAIREEEWTNALKWYNHRVEATLQSVIGKLSPNKLPLIKDYSFEPFYAHFKKYAFYGVMICMHYLPWLVGTKEELEQLSMWFERDMHSEEFHKLSLTAGGDDANQRIFEVFKHACKQGYLDFILSD